MNILTFETNEELNQNGASIIASLVQTKPHAVLGLATGSTPIGIYQEPDPALRKRICQLQAGHLVQSG